MLANLYLHYGFDTWMDSNHPNNPFERYADDIVIHCGSKEEAYQLLKSLETQMGKYLLTLHPEKTKVVYCKNEFRKEEHDQISFTFLSYTFRPRGAIFKHDRNKILVFFNGAISNDAQRSIRQSCRKILNPNRSSVNLESFVKVLNPKIRGWINYYGKFFRRRLIRVFSYLDGLILKWIHHKYKLTSKKKSLLLDRRIKELNPDLFFNWRL